MWQVIGQARAVSMLRNGLAAGNTAHAYLMVGPAHIGKMTLAVNLAQALNCEAAEPPCLECGPCRKIAAMGHADVQVIGLARNGDAAEARFIGIDQIKQAQHSASLPPFEGKQRVFIIDNAELLSIEAANCLLKTLEEPADKVTFVLLAANDRLLPKTVVSRCQRLDLPPLPVTEEAAALAEGWGIEPERARLLAGLSHGCPGWAISAIGDNSRLEKRSENFNQIMEIMAAGSTGRFAYVNKIAAGFSQDRSAVYDTLDLWLDFWRDLLLVKLGCYDMITSIDRRDELEAAASGYGLDEVRGFIESIRTAAGNLRANANPRLALEVLMLDVPKKKEVTGRAR